LGNIIRITGFVAKQSLMMAGPTEFDSAVKPKFIEHDFDARSNHSGSCYSAGPNVASNTRYS